MKIAVFDTYVLRPDGRRMHFDILVPDQSPDKDVDAVLAFGRRYLAAKQLPAESLTAQECRFCHVASAPPSVEEEMAGTGFAIIELQNCD